MGELIEQKTYQVGGLTAMEIRSRVNRIREVMDAVMKPGVHYGTIPGTPKPTLYKPGAEKILMTFQIAAEDPIVTDMCTADEVRYRVTVRGVTQSAAPVFLGAGTGECSSSEEKYKWRKPVCDEEWNETQEDRRREKWFRGKGEPYKARQIRTNPSDVANTVLKMAVKRAMVAMTLVVTAASDVFDQDIEELSDEVRESLVEGNAAPATEIKPPQRKAAPTEKAPPANGNGWRPMKARFASKCAACGDGIGEGDEIYYSAEQKAAQHRACHEQPKFE